MTCERTGCDVFLEEYQAWYHGDSYRVGTTVILRLAVASRSLDPPSRVHYRVSRIGAAFPSGEPGASERIWTVAAEDRHAIYYGYEGRTTHRLVGQAPEERTPEDQEDRDLVLIAREALEAAASNDGAVPKDDEECAADMIEHGVFGPSEDCVDQETGAPLRRYVEAVRAARAMEK